MKEDLYPQHGLKSASGIEQVLIQCHTVCIPSQHGTHVVPFKKYFTLHQIQTI